MPKIVENVKRRLSVFVEKMKTKDDYYTDSDSDEYSDSEDEERRRRAAAQQQRSSQVGHFKPRHRSPSMPQIDTLGLGLGGHGADGSSRIHSPGNVPVQMVGYGGLRSGPSGSQASVQTLTIKEFMNAKSRSARSDGAGSYHLVDQDEPHYLPGQPGHLLPPTDRPVSPIRYTRRSSIALTK